MGKEIGISLPVVVDVQRLWMQKQEWAEILAPWGEVELRINSVTDTFFVVVVQIVHLFFKIATLFYEGLEIT